MFSALPRRIRFMIRGTLAASWLLVSLGALVGLIFTDLDPIRDIASAAITVTTVIAALGVVANRYRWEWVAAWFSTAALAPHILAAWALAFSGHPLVFQTAFLLTGLAGFFVVRALMCAAHAAKQRELSELDPEGWDA